jgi:hypothetical protein
LLPGGDTEAGAFVSRRGGLGGESGDTEVAPIYRYTAVSPLGRNTDVSWGVGGMTSEAAVEVECSDDDAVGPARGGGGGVHVLW